MKPDTVNWQPLRNKKQHETPMTPKLDHAEAMSFGYRAVSQDRRPQRQKCVSRDHDMKAVKHWLSVVRSNITSEKAVEL